MKAIEFGEERLTDIEGLARELWQDERDPRSSAYVRVLERPPVHWGRVCAWTVLPFVFTAALLGLAYSWGFLRKLPGFGGGSAGFVWLGLPKTGDHRGNPHLPALCPCLPSKQVPVRALLLSIYDSLPGKIWPDKRPAKGSGPPAPVQCPRRRI